MEGLEAADQAGNPLVALAAALIHAFLYILRAIRVVVAFITISIPT